LELQDSEGQNALWLALNKLTDESVSTEGSIAAKLIKRGASSNAVNGISGKRLNNLIPDNFIFVLDGPTIGV
jgi:hypothetical protein